jgi:hypothetical protein
MSLLNIIGMVCLLCRLCYISSFLPYRNSFCHRKLVWDFCYWYKSNFFVFITASNHFINTACSSAPTAELCIWHGQPAQYVNLYPPFNFGLACCWIEECSRFRVRDIPDNFSEHAVRQVRNKRQNFVCKKNIIKMYDLIGLRVKKKLQHNQRIRCTVH